MTYQNLSTIGATCVIEFDGERGPEYWMGGTDWTQDLEQAQRYGTGNALRFMTMLWNRGLKVRCKTVPGQYQVMKWVGLGWVVINYRGEESTVHRIRLVNEADNWFFTSEQECTICLRLGSDTEDHYQINLKGDQIVDVTLFTSGEVMEDFTTFGIPDDSNLQYLFEFESTPVVELEVA